jgi:hypothetical protein
VEPDPWQVGHRPLEAVEELAEGLGVEEPAGGVENIQSSAPWGRPSRLEASPPPCRTSIGRVVEVDAAAAGAGLDRELDGWPAMLWRVRLIDRRWLAVEVGPLEPGDFAAAHPGAGGEVQRRVEPVSARRTQERRQLGAVQDRGTVRVWRLWRALVACGDVASTSWRRMARSRLDRTITWTSWTVLGARPVPCRPPVVASWS